MFCHSLRLEIHISSQAQAVAPALHYPPMPHWLANFGVLGLFAVAAIDSSVIPLLLPGSTDLLLLWLVAHGGDPCLLAANAIAGSILGGYSTWQVGRRGGEAALRRYVPARMLVPMNEWVKRNPVLAVFLPAFLPPPLPLSPFVLAAGALGISWKQFLTVFGIARCLRYSLIAWLGASYGRKLVSVWAGTLDKWYAPLFWIFCGLLASGICLGVWKARALIFISHPVA